MLSTTQGDAAQNATGELLGFVPTKECMCDCSCVLWSFPAHNCSPHRDMKTGLLSVTLYGDNRHRFGESLTWRTLGELGPHAGIITMHCMGVLAGVLLCQVCWCARCGRCARCARCTRCADGVMCWCASTLRHMLSRRLSFVSCLVLQLLTGTSFTQCRLKQLITTARDTHAWTVGRDVNSHRHYWQLCVDTLRRTCPHSAYLVNRTAEPQVLQVWSCVCRLSAMSIWQHADVTQKKQHQPFRRSYRDRDASLLRGEASPSTDPGSRGSCSSSPSTYCVSGQLQSRWRWRYSSPRNYSSTAQHSSTA
jgi:hypothetical protein